MKKTMQLTVVFFVMFACIANVYAQTATDTISFVATPTVSVGKYTTKNDSTYYTLAMYNIGKSFNSSDSSSCISRCYYTYTWTTAQIPSNATIAQVTVGYSTGSGSYTFKITQVSSPGSDYAANYNAIGNGSSMNTGIGYGTGSFTSSSIKTALQNALSSRTLYLGALSESESTIGSCSSLSLTLTVVYTHPSTQLSFTARNDLDGADGGSIGVGIDVAASSHGSPYPFTAYEKHTINLAAYDNQNVNNRTWVFNDNEATANKSSWVYRYNSHDYSLSSSQTTSYYTDRNKNNVQLNAYLKKYCNIALKEQTEFGTVVSNSLLQQIIEGNSTSVTAPSSLINGGINYYFSGWSDNNGSNQRTVTPSDHDTRALSWSYHTITSYEPEAVRGTALNDFFMCGANGEMLHYNGVTWKSYIEQIGSINGWYLGLAVKGNTVIAVGENAPYASILMGKRQ